MNREKIIATLLAAGDRWSKTRDFCSDDKGRVCAVGALLFDTGWSGESQELPPYPDKAAVLAYLGYTETAVEPAMATKEVAA